MKWFPGAAALVMPLALASCDDSAGPLARLRAPASIAIDATDLEVGDGDTVLVSANVFDQHERVYASIPPGARMEWSSDDASVAEVGAGGRLIGNAPGTTTIRVRLGDLEAEAPVSVVPVAREMVLVALPTADFALPSMPLPDSVVLRVVDRHGTAMPGVEVHFRVTAGGGSVSPSSAFSDANGLVHVEWTLGPVFGVQAIEAAAPGIGDPVDIRLTVARVIRGGFVAPAQVAQGGTLPVSVRLDTDLFPAAVGGAHLVVSWDPGALRLNGAVGPGDYARVQSRLDAAAGELHLLSLDAAVARGAISAGELTFDVIGGPGTTSVTLVVAQLVATNFNDVSTAGVVQDLVVTIDPAGTAP